MKKLVLIFVAVAAISFASCGNRTNASVADKDSDSILPVVGDDNLIDLEDSLKNDSNQVK